jgi:hypothetical protein
LDGHTSQIRQPSHLTLPILPRFARTPSAAPACPRTPD